MMVREHLAEQRDLVTGAERRVAEVVLADPEVVAFGTVASVAGRAGTSGATVVRFANRLGYDGFVGLQAAVQQELSGRLRPAAERIREPAPADVIGRTLAAETTNLHRTLDAVERTTFDRAVSLLSRRSGRVAVLPGGASHGVARQFTDELSLLRSGVELVWGTPLAVVSTLAGYRKGDMVVAVDLRRYDQAVVAGTEVAVDAGADLVAVTDSLLSPLAADAAATLVVAAESAGPFDSHVACLALFGALVAGVAGRLRSTATDRLDRIERAWRASGALADS